MQIPEINYFTFNKFSFLINELKTIENYIKNKILNLFILKINSQAFSEKKKSIKEKNVVLVLSASSDENGVLSMPRPLFFHRLKNHGKIKVIKKKVSSIQDIEREIETVKQQGASLKGILINAHTANNHVLILGNNPSKSDCIITNHSLHGDTGILHPNVHQLKNALGSIDKTGFIILDACEAGLVVPRGKPLESKPCIAQSFADLAPGRTVYAPTEEIHAWVSTVKWSSNASKKDQITVKFNNPKRCVKGHRIYQTILNIFYIYLGMFHLVRNDVTAKFKAMII